MVPDHDAPGTLRQRRERGREEELVAGRLGFLKRAAWLPCWLLLGASALFLLLSRISIRCLTPERACESALALPPGALLGGLPPEEAMSVLYRALFAATFAAASGAFVLVLARLRAQRLSMTLPRLLAWTALLGLPLLFVMPTFFGSGDIYSYIVYGRVAAVYDANPFVETPDQFPQRVFLVLASWDHTPSVYGPFWVVLSHGLTVIVEALGGGVNTYIGAYKLLAFGAHLANTALLWAILGRWKPGRQVSGTVFYAWNPLMLLECVATAHNDVLTVTMILCSVWLCLRKRPVAAILALTMAVLIKWIIALVVPFLGLMLLRQQQGWRERALFVLKSTLFALGATALLYLPYWTDFRTLGNLTKTPSLTSMTNSLHEFVLSERLYLWLPGGGPARPLGAEADADTRRAQELVDDVSTAEQREQARRERTAALMEQRAAERRAKGYLQLVGWASLILAWGCWVWRVRDLDRFVAASFWVLFVYLVISTGWFEPWYVTWCVAFAALSDQRRVRRTALVFALAASMIHIAYPWSDPPALISRYRAPLALVPPMIVALLPRRGRDSPRLTGTTEPAD